MTVLVIVHGGWGGAWEWAGVAGHLRRLGHRVVTPTLAGMGARARERGPIGLAAHRDDVIAAIPAGPPVVLCAHSYAGMPASAAADHRPERIALLVYIDALVPRDGQSALDLLPEAFRRTVREGLAAHGPAWRVPMPEQALPPPAAGLDEETRRRYIARLTDQPARTFADEVTLTGPLERLPRGFVRCTATGLAARLGDDPIAPFAARARSEGWPYREIAAPHDPQLFDPAQTARVLHSLATGAVAGRAPQAPPDH